MANVRHCPEEAMRRWLSHFCFENFGVENAFRTGQPVTEQDDEIIAEVEQEQYVSNCDIAKELHIHQQRILNHLKKTSYKNNSMLGCHPPYSLD